MKKLLFAFTCLCGLCGCLNMNDDSTIDERSIVITRGKIRDIYVEAYVDVEAKGLKGIDVVLPDYILNGEDFRLQNGLDINRNTFI